MITLTWENIKPFTVVYEYVRDMWDYDCSKLSFVDYGISLGINMEVDNGPMKIVEVIILDEELLSFILLNRSYE